MQKEIVYTENAPNPIGPYSQAIKANEMVFTAGQIGLASSGEMAEGLEAQTRLAIDNLVAVLQAGGASLESVVMVLACAGRPAPAAGFQVWLVIRLSLTDVRILLIPP